MKEKSCMKFSNEEILKYFVKPLKKIKNIDLKIIYDEESNAESEYSISHICLDGDKEEIFISFYEVQTSIFFKDDIEIMFVDENYKKNYTLSDTYDNIVYEGNLNDLSHEKLLFLFKEIISLFIDVFNVEIIDKNLNKKYKKTYPVFEYKVRIYNKDHDIKYKKFKNIIFESE